MQRTLLSKIIFSVAGLLIMLAMAVAALTFVQMRGAAIEERAKVLDVLNYSLEILLSQDALPSLQRVTENSATVEGVRKVAIFDRRMVVLASSNRFDVGKGVTSTPARDLMERASWEQVRYETADELVLLQPLRGGQFMGGATGDVVGVAQVTIALQDINDTARTAALRLLAISLGSYVILFVLLAVVLRVLVTKPVEKLAAVARRFRKGDRSLRSQIRRKDEIGLLSKTFDEMADEVDAILDGLEGQVASRTVDLEEKRAALEKALDELKAGTAARLSLAATVRALSTPVIKLYDQILVMPLVGSIDAERSQQIERSMLEGIHAGKAREVIVDLTGIPVVDTEAAAGLMRAASAARLLGAGVTFVGIGPSVAQSIVRLGVDFAGISTGADLQRGLIDALRRLGLMVARREAGRSA